MNDLQRGKIWTIQLLAVACLSLAVKMEEINVLLTVDLQVNTKCPIQELVFIGLS